MNRLRELRLLNNYSQAKLGQLLGCTAATISKYELNQREIDTSTISRLCDIFSCTSDYLLCRTDEPGQQLPRGEKLDSELQRMIADLNPEDEAIVKAFVAGLKASRKS